LHTLVGTLLDGETQRIDSAAALAACAGAVPVTVVWGTADRIIPPAQAESVTGAASRLVDGAGHMPHMERPAEVTAEVEESTAGGGWVAPGRPVRFPRGRRLDRAAGQLLGPRPQARRGGLVVRGRGELHQLGVTPAHLPRAVRAEVVPAVHARGGG